MHHRFTLGLVFALFTAILALAGCVDVPDSIRAQFAAPSVQERTNYRPGRHGSARPFVDPANPTAKAASNDADAGAASDERSFGSTTTTSASTEAPNAPNAPNAKDAKDGGAQ